MKWTELVIVVLVLAGAGIWLSRKSDAPKREEAYRRMEEDRQRSAMTTFADGLLQSCTARKKTKEKDLSGLRGDATRLSAIVSSDIAKDGKSDGDMKVLRILNNSDVNALALKYLGSDFAGVKDSFTIRIKDAVAAEERYAAAVKEADDAFATNAQQAASLTKKTMSQRDTEIKRLTGEIRALEKRRNMLQEEYKNKSSSYYSYGKSAASNANRERNEATRSDVDAVLKGKLSDVDSEISKKRRQIDSLTTPDAIRRFENDMLRDAQTVQRNAFIFRNQALRDIDYRLKPKVSSAAIISELEAKSIEKLRSTIAAKISECEKSIKELSDRITAIEEFRLSIPVSDIQDLVRRKGDLGK